MASSHGETSMRVDNTECKDNPPQVQSSSCPWIVNSPADQWLCRSSETAGTLPHWLTVTAIWIWHYLHSASLETHTFVYMILTVKMPLQQTVIARMADLRQESRPTEVLLPVEDGFIFVLNCSIQGIHSFFNFNQPDNPRHPRITQTIIEVTA